jgi:uncharacterized protein YqkB
MCADDSNSRPIYRKRQFSHFFGDEMLFKQANVAKRSTFVLLSDVRGGVAEQVSAT